MMIILIVMIIALGGTIAVINSKGPIERTALLLRLGRKRLLCLLLLLGAIQGISADRLG